MKTAKLLAPLLALLLVLPGMAQTDSTVFALLDLTRPGLEEVARYHAAGNDPAAADALLAYFRNRKAKAPLALIGVPSIVPRILIDSIEKGDISCMVIRNPELRKKKIDTSKLKATDDFEETFKMRFVLVTKDNLEQYKEVLRD